jgi:hypothetical protein
MRPSPTSVTSVPWGSPMADLTLGATTDDIQRTTLRVVRVEIICDETTIGYVEVVSEERSTGSGRGSLRHQAPEMSLPFRDGITREQWDLLVKAGSDAWVAWEARFRASDDARFR